MHFGSVDDNIPNAVGVSSASFDADDEDWSVMIVADEYMVESPLHQKIRKSAIGGGSEDLGRERQQSDEPDLLHPVPSHWQLPRISGIHTSISSDDHVRTAAAAERQAVERDDEELRLDVMDGQWYTRSEFKTEYGGLRQWHAAPRTHPESEDSEAGEEGEVAPVPVDQDQVNLPTHDRCDDSSDEDQFAAVVQDRTDAVIVANHGAVAYDEHVSRATRTSLVPKVAGPAKREKYTPDGPAVSIASNANDCNSINDADAIDNGDKNIPSPRTSLVPKARASPAAKETYAVDVHAVTAMNSNRARNNDSDDDKYEVPTSSQPTTPCIGPPAAQQITTKRALRRQRQRSLRRQRRLRRRRVSEDHSAPVSVQTETTSGTPATDQLASEVTNGLTTRSNKYVAPTSVNPKVVSNTTTIKDEYVVEISTRRVRTTNHHTLDIDGDKYAASIAVQPNVTAGAVPEKVQYAVDSPVAMPTITKHLKIDKSDKYTIPTSTQPKVRACATVTRDQYAVDTIAPTGDTTSHSNISSDDKYADRNAACTTFVQAKVVASPAETNDRYAVDTPGVRVPTAIHHNTSSDGDKYAVPTTAIQLKVAKAVASTFTTQDQNKVDVPTASADTTSRHDAGRNAATSTSSTTDRHALVAKATTASQQHNASGGKYEAPVEANVARSIAPANDQYAVDTPQATLHIANQRKTDSGDDTDKYIVRTGPQPKVAAGASTDENDRYVVDVPATTRRTDHQHTDKNGDKYAAPTFVQAVQPTMATSTTSCSASTNDEKYVVSTSIQLKLAASPATTACQHEDVAAEPSAVNNADNKFPEDKYAVPTLQPVVIASHAPATIDPYAVKLDDSSPTNAASDRVVASPRRSTRQKRLRSLKHRRERRRNRRRSRAPQRDNTGNNDTPPQNGEKLENTDSKCGITSGEVERLV